MVYTHVTLKSAVLIELFGTDHCILIGDATVPEGALATREQFESFAMNPCHLNPDGTITRFGKTIATIADIEI